MVKSYYAQSPLCRGSHAWLRQKMFEVLESVCERVGIEVKEGVSVLVEDIAFCYEQNFTSVRYLFDRHVIRALLSILWPSSTQIRIMAETPHFEQMGEVELWICGVTRLGVRFGLKSVRDYLKDFLLWLPQDEKE